MNIFSSLTFTKIKWAAISLTIVGFVGYNYWLRIEQDRAHEKDKADFREERANLNNAILSYAGYIKELKDKQVIAEKRKAAVDERANEALRTIYANAEASRTIIDDSFRNLLRNAIDDYKATAPQETLSIPMSNTVDNARKMRGTRSDGRRP